MANHLFLLCCAFDSNHTLDSLFLRSILLNRIGVWMLVCPPSAFFPSSIGSSIAAADALEAHLALFAPVRSTSQPYTTDNGLCAAPAIWATRHTKSNFLHFFTFVSKEKVRRTEWEYSVNHDIWLNRWKWKALNSVSAHRCRSIIAGCCCRRRRKHQNIHTYTRFNCPHLRIWCDHIFDMVRGTRVCVSTWPPWN